MKIALRPRDDAPFEVRKAYHELPNIEKWGPGPWADEPNRELWKAHGLDCLVNRNSLGAWCGYVGVPKGHPYYGLSYRDLYERLYPDVHGGLTYSDHCQGEICHLHDEGEAPVFWFGFDCANAFDLVPAMDAMRKYDPRFPKDLFLVSREVYRDLAYAKAETESLAEQLAGVS